VKKRILQIIATLDRAGAEKQMGLLARGLPREEFEVHVCALSRGGPLLAELVAAGVPTTVIGQRWPLDPQACWRLRRHVARLRPDLIHTWRFAAHVCGHVVGRACGVKCLIAGPDCVAPGKGWFELAADGYVARHSSRVVLSSTEMRDRWVRCGLPAEKVRVIPSGVAPAEPPAGTRRQLLEELGLPAQSRLVGLVGGLWPRKRIKDAIWAADLLKVIRDDVHLLIVGAGPHRDRLWKFRDQVLIRDKVHFLGERGDVPRLLPHFDVFWSASAYEGQSNAILEAMAAGVPVVATDIPGTRDLVVHETTGYLVPVGDRAGLTRWTNKLLDDAALARRLGQAGRQRALGEFSAEKMIERHAEMYRELLG
jgi:glycosyltransferase involved in cell wall biosynthesis